MKHKEIIGFISEDEVCPICGELRFVLNKAGQMEFI